MNPTNLQNNFMNFNFNPSHEDVRNLFKIKTIMPSKIIDDPKTQNDKEFKNLVELGKKLKTNIAHSNNSIYNKLNDISIRIKERIFQENLTRNDINSYRNELNTIISSNFYNQAIENFFKICILLANNHTLHPLKKIKSNYFESTNKTDGISALNDGQPICDVQISDENLNDLSTLWGRFATKSKLILLTNDLKNANLTSVDLKNADLSRANLHMANLRNTDLRGANFNEAHLSGVDFSGATFDNDHQITLKFDGHVDLLMNYATYAYFNNLSAT